MRWSDIPQFIQSSGWECDYSLSSFVEFIEENERDFGLQMNPDFQRGHLWTEEQQVAYIEFLLRGGKTARVIYLNNNNWQKVNPDKETYFVCVDGLQRTIAIKRFVNNEIKAFGLYYRDFEGNPRVVQGVRVNVNDLQTRKEVLQWYIEFNSGGTVHTKEEIDRVKKLLSRERAKNLKHGEMKELTVIKAADSSSLGGTIVRPGTKWMGWWDQNAEKGTGKWKIDYDNGFVGWWDDEYFDYKDK